MGKRWLVAVDSSKNGEKAFQVCFLQCRTSILQSVNCEVILPLTRSFVLPSPQVVCGMMNKKEDELFVLSVAEPLTTVTDCKLESVAG